MSQETFEEARKGMRRLEAAFLPRITLKSLKHAAYLSEETLAFTATVYFDGQRIGQGRNDGHGGCTDVDPSSAIERERFNAARDEIKAHPDADQYCSMDFLVSCAVDRDLRLRDDKRLVKAGKIAWVDSKKPSHVISIKWKAVAAGWPQTKAEFLVEAQKEEWITDPSTVTFVNDRVSL